jgi:hypothetical protein
VETNEKRDLSASNRDAELFVDLVLDGEAVRVPAEATFHMEAASMGVPRHNILQRTFFTRGAHEFHPSIITISQS